MFHKCFTRNQPNTHLQKLEKKYIIMFCNNNENKETNLSRHQYQPSSLDTKFKNGEQAWIVSKSPALEKLYSKKENTTLENLHDKRT